MRVAALDLGTNTTRLLVADVEDSEVRGVVRRTVVTRLGEGVDRRRVLLPTALARVRNALVDFRREAAELGAERALLVATSAVRDAENGEAFLGEIEWSYGFATRLLDGRAEAELTFRGVTTGGLARGRTLVLDVGGGSTELVLGVAHEVEQAVSIDIGSVRLTERFLPSDPPTASQLRAVRDHAAAALPSWRVEHGVGVAGTVTTIAALDLGLAAYDPDRVHGHVLTRAALEVQLERLAGLPLAERLRVPALEPGRAPVIVAGAAIVAAAMSACELETLVASERDLLDGVALLASELPDRDEGQAPPQAFTAC